MKFCVKCGNTLSDKARFCKSCGNTVRQRTNTSPPRNIRPKNILLIVIFATVILSSISISVHFMDLSRSENTLLNMPMGLHYIYRSDITVIGHPPAYSFTEQDDTLRIVVQRPNRDILRLSVGDTFVFAPTTESPSGLAGHVLSISEQGNDMIIIARIPESLDEIFYEFEFSGEFNLLEFVDEIEIGEDFYNAEGVRLIRNRTTLVGVEFINFNRAGVTISGEITLYRPTISASISRSVVNYLVVQTGAEIEIEVEIEGSFDRTFELFRIPLTVLGTGITVPVALRFTAEGRAELEFEAGVETEFGIRNNRPIARFDPWYNLEFDFSARATLTLNIQAQARVLLVPIYGVQADFGKGIQSNTTMQNRCSTSVCLVLETFHVREVSSLRGWGVLRGLSILQFRENLAQNVPSTFWYVSDSRLRRYCPHSPLNLPEQELILGVDALLIGGWQLDRIVNDDGTRGFTQRLDFFEDGTGTRQDSPLPTFNWRIEGDGLIYMTAAGVVSFEISEDELRFIYDWNTGFSAIYRKISQQAQTEINASVATERVYLERDIRRIGTQQGIHWPAHALVGGQRLQMGGEFFDRGFSNATGSSFANITYTIAGEGFAGVSGTFGFMGAAGHIPRGSGVLTVNRDRNGLANSEQIASFSLSPGDTPMQFDLPIPSDVQHITFVLRVTRQNEFAPYTVTVGIGDSFFYR